MKRGENDATTHGSGAVGPDGSAYASLGAEYRIARFAPDGDTAFVIQRAVPPARLTATERDSALAALSERYREATGTEPRDLPAIPEHAPAVAAMRVDDLGLLWVLRGGPAAGDTCLASCATLRGPRRAVLDAAGRAA